MQVGGILNTKETVFQWNIVSIPVNEKMKAHWLFETWNDYHKKNKKKNKTWIKQTHICDDP